MTSEKARDFFSAYREGSLEPGLRISLERKFESDAELRSEYAGFCETLESVEGLKSEVIDLPFDLHDVISARVDRDIWEQKRSASAGWFGRLRLAAMAGAGALVLFGAIYSISRHGQPGSTGADLTTIPVASGLEVQSKPDGLWVTYAPSEDRDVLFRSGASALPFERERVGKNSPLRQRLENPGSATVLLKIEVEDTPNAGQLEIAVPGVHQDGTLKGSGTLEEFVKALAGHYRESVMLNGVDPQTQVVWDFTQSEGRGAAETALGDRFGIDQDENDLLTIRRGK